MSKAFAIVATTLALATLTLTVAPAGASHPGVNGKIAFARAGEILAMNADGSGLVNLTNSAQTGDWQPAFSPDGSLIAFSREVGSGEGDIYVMGADGAGAKRVTTHAAHDYAPSFSPDGTRIVFARTVAYPNVEIFVINADGTGEQRLTNNAAFDASPTFSADGTKIAFQSDRDGASDVYVMNADGAAVTRLTMAGGSMPDFSPDGSRLAYVTGGEIEVIGAGGGPSTPLTRDGFDNANPTFSPDGTKVAFSRGISGDIYVTSADGTGAATPLTTGGGVQPSWQPLRPAVPPSNLFSLGKLKRNTDKGTAKLEVIVPGPGQVELAKTAKLKPDAESVAAAGTVRLKLAARGNARRKLSEVGVAAKTVRVKLAATVAYTPTGGATNAITKRVKLVRSG